MKNIYLDHAATTPVDKRIFEKMKPFFVEEFANPSSIHSMGQKASVAVSESREKVSDFLNCEPNEVIFTSGATESNNIAIFGVIETVKKKKLGKPHIITSTIEHPAVRKCFCKLERSEDAEVTYLPVDQNGVVSKDDLENAIQENTALVSIMYVNNEIGSVQPISEISKIIEKIRQKRKKEKSDFPIYFHTDAVQAANFFSCDISDLGVDMLSLSGHKIYGPKGVGVLFAKKSIPLMPVQFGGRQEKGLRSGTLNVPGIVGIGEALSLAKKERKENVENVKELRNFLVNEIQKNIPDVLISGDIEKNSPGHANIIFKGAEGESILLDLDSKGVCVSTGSACAAHSLKSSQVLLEIGVSPEDIHGAIRFSLGKKNTKEEMEKVASVLPAVVKRFRDMAPEYK